MKVRDPSGKLVDVEAIDIIEAKEQWNFYKLADGTTLRVKPVVVRVVKFPGYYNEDGDPLYQVRTRNVVASDVPDSLKQITNP